MFLWKFNIHLFFVNKSMCRAGIQMSRSLFKLYYLNFKFSFSHRYFIIRNHLRNWNLRKLLSFPPIRVLF